MVSATEYGDTGPPGTSKSSSDKSNKKSFNKSENKELEPFYGNKFKNKDLKKYFSTSPEISPSLKPSTREIELKGFYEESSIKLPEKVNKQEEKKEDTSLTKKITIIKDTTTPKEKSTKKETEIKKDTEINILDSALLDCYGRFITLLPESVLRDYEHLPFHLQEAFWWYCDKWQIKYEKLPELTFSEFLQLICNDCPILKKFVTSEDLKTMIKRWTNYRKRIPVRGGIIFNYLLDKVLLVQAYRSKSWSFPRGKIDEGEDDKKCASREILEETGLDLYSLIDKDVYLELVDEEVNLKLFLIPGVDESSRLKQSSSYEISKFRWVSLKQLENVKYLKFATFQVKPFVKKILQFSKDFQNGKFSQRFPEQFATYQIELNNKIRNSKLSNNETFGLSSSWSPEEMFRVNTEKFGIVSTYKEEDYENFNVFQSWTPVEITKTRGKYRDKELVPFNPDTFMN